MLTPLEPRLVRKLLPPLSNLISTTPAMSLLYECINTLIVGGLLSSDSPASAAETEALAQSCVDKLAAFLEDADQNLRYMALLALNRMLPTHPHLVAAHHATILACVDDPDVTIRSRALELIDGMVDRSTLQPVVRQLMAHLTAERATAGGSASVAALQAIAGGAGGISDGGAGLASYRSMLAHLIVSMAGRQTYAFVANFAWLIDTLVALAYVALSLPPESSSLGVRLADMIRDICARVRAARPHAVRKLARLLEDDTFVDGAAEDGTGAAAMLAAASFVVAEYAADAGVDVEPAGLFDSLFSADALGKLPPAVAASYLHNGLKLVARRCSALARGSLPLADDVVLELRRTLTNAIEACGPSASRGGTDDDDALELVARASQVGALLRLLVAAMDEPTPTPPQKWADEAQAADDVPAPTYLSLLSPLFDTFELGPVNAKAQGLIAPPEGLNLDHWIGPPPVDSEDDAPRRAVGEVDEFGRPKGVNFAALGSNGHVDESDALATRAKKGKARREDEADLSPAERKAAKARVRGTVQRRV